MSELITRLEALGKPCRELDAEILKVYNPTFKIHFIRDKSDVVVGCHATSQDYDYRQIVTYTRSVDAALTLIPDGLMQVFVNDLEGWSVGLFKVEWVDKRYKGGGKSLPIAICIAALRARDGAVS